MTRPRKQAPCARRDFSKWRKCDAAVMRPGPAVVEPRLLPADVPLKVHRGFLWIERYVVVEVVRARCCLPRGYRGYMLHGPGCGTSMYESHLEVPVDGIGIPIDAVVVVELDERGEEIKTRYREWCRGLGVVVLCTRCREEVLPAINPRCPDTEAWLEQRRIRLREEAKRERDRRAWAAKHPELELPALARPRRGASELCTGMRTARDARRVAREYSYDFEGVHVVKRERGWYAVYATARKDVGGASEPWPIKVLVPG